MIIKSLLSAGASLVALIAPFPAMAQAQAAEAAGAAVTSAPRERIPLAEGWQFNLAGTDAAAIVRPRDEDWKVVSIPHTWNRVGYYLSDPETHFNSAEMVEKTQGVGWYYLSFTPPAGAAGRQAFLEFDAASRTAEVWLNGKLIGTHRNPFARFRIDATDAIRFGQENALYVKVDNTQPVEGASTAEVLPMAGDFFVRGGLYRPVNLVLTDPVHFDLLDFGGPGVYATTRSISGDRADVGLNARLRNASGAAQQVVITARLIDDTGKDVASWTGNAALGAGATVALDGALSVASPRLWHGITDPYLYTLRFDLRSASGALLDTVEQSFGIREMRLDPERGFLLNGKVYPLRGVGMHQDNEQSDWAISPEEVERSVRLMRDMGANSIRLAHYQHGQPVHDLADRMGIVLWDEIGLVTAWTNARTQTETPAAIEQNAQLQLQELIRQNHNHASVAVWGIANEVDFGPGRPDFLGRPPEVLANPIPLLEGLSALAKEMDPSRAVVLAHCCENRGMPNVPLVAETVDAVGANLYYGWYYGSPADLGPHLDGLRTKRPGQPLSISEYGAGAAPNMHSDNPLGGPIDLAGRTQPEEFASWFHEESWRALKDRPYLWGVWLWNGFDFGTTVRTEGDAQDVNTKGLVSYDRKILKDAYYFYRANWSEQPTVHVNGRRYVDRAYPVTDVRIYSNAPATTLTVNSKNLGRMSDCPLNICVWPGVRLDVGANTITARGEFPTGAVDDRIEWRLDAAQARSFRIDSGVVVAGAADVQFGSDDFFVGGSAGTADQPGGRGRRPVFAEIAGTDRRNVVASFRRGDFHYRVPVRDGRYLATLTFVEPDKAVGERVFDVVANGETKLAGYDIHARAGAVLKAVEESFEVTVTGGMLDLHFRPKTGEALVSALEIVPVD
jgi:beta-galactosidase